jgi:hypothetical protein
MSCIGFTLHIHGQQQHPGQFHSHRRAFLPPGRHPSTWDTAQGLVLPPRPRGRKHLPLHQFQPTPCMGCHDTGDISHDPLDIHSQFAVLFESQSSSGNAPSRLYDMHASHMSGGHMSQPWYTPGQTFRASGQDHSQDQVDSVWAWDSNCKHCPDTRLIIRLML